MIQYVRSPVVGSGTLDDPFRPAIVDVIPPTVTWEATDERAIKTQPMGTMMVAVESFGKDPLIIPKEFGVEITQGEFETRSRYVPVSEKSKIPVVLRPPDTMAAAQQKFDRGEKLTTAELDTQMAQLKEAQPPIVVVGDVK